jgi:hypothetical protein
MLLTALARTIDLRSDDQAVSADGITLDVPVKPVSDCIN